MKLGHLFTAVAVLEASYFAVAMVPPAWVRPLTGWELTPDGHWIVKLIGLALLTQAIVAWIFRRQPHLGVAKALAFYQIASATMDIVMWVAMSDAGIFGNSLARTTVTAAIVSHYALGLLLVIAIVRETPAARPLPS